MHNIFVTIYVIIVKVVYTKGYVMWMWCMLVNWSNIQKKIRWPHAHASLRFTEIVFSLPFSFNCALAFHLDNPAM